MKIRINDNSIRLRLDRREVEEIGEQRAIECCTKFTGGNDFRYRLKVSDTKTVKAFFSEGCIEVALPRPIAEHWVRDEAEVSIQGENDIDGGSLKLLIEKDFECLEPRSGEDQRNRFINPKAVS